MGYFAAGYFTPQYYGPNYWRETPIVPPTPSGGGGIAVYESTRKKRGPDYGRLARDVSANVRRAREAQRARRRARLLREDEELLIILAEDN